MEYKELNEQLEATLSVTTHDFEAYLKKNGFQGMSLELISEKEKNQLEKIINSHLSLSINDDQNIYFTVEGIESQLTGISLLYLHAVNVKPFAAAEITFDLLMDFFPEQQNKLTFIFRDKKYTFAFLTNYRNAELKLEKG